MTTSNQIAIHIDDTSVNGKLVKTVNARNLYEQLAVRKDFSDWAKNQIKRLRLIEDRDYVVAQTLSTPSRGDQVHGGDRRSVEYHFTTRASEQIAMISLTDKGFEVRDYFIDIRDAHLKLLNEKTTQPTLGTGKYASIGEALVNAVRNQEYDSAKELEAMLDKLDFGPAARTEGVPEAFIRRRIAIHTAATVRLEHIARGEHAHTDSVREVLKLAQSTVQSEDTQTRAIAQRRHETLLKQSYHQLLANDMLEKHAGGVQ